jgi:excisionase family DNA binding protein
MSSNIRVPRICCFCGTEFTARTTVTKYCGDRCASRAYKNRKRHEGVQQSHLETADVISLPVTLVQSKDFLNVRDVCLLLGVSKRTVLTAVNDGRIKAIRLGRRIVIKRTDVDCLFS